jgi:co-chaperonin GroES (HSP10)
VAAASVALVEGGGVDAVEPLHPRRKARARASEDEVIVRRHQAQRVKFPAVIVCARDEEAEERAAVGCVSEQRGVGDGVCVDMEVAVGERAAKDARHRRRPP